MVRNSRPYGTSTERTFASSTSLAQCPSSIGIPFADLLGQHPALGVAGEE